MRKRNLIMFFAWFVVSMIYYGLTFSAKNIDASVFLTVGLGGIVEIPSIFAVLPVLEKLVAYFKKGFYSYMKIIFICN